MKKLTIILAIAAATLAARPGKAPSGQSVFVCHGPIGTWGRAVEVTAAKVSEHLSHGDYELPIGYSSGDGRCAGTGSSGFKKPSQMRLAMAR
jgi:hypothetical protein